MGPHRKNMHEKVTYQLTDTGPTAREVGREVKECGRVVSILNFQRKMKQKEKNSNIGLIFEDRTWVSVYCLFSLLLY